MLCVAMRTRILDVGCGLNKVAGAIGLDRARHTAADVRADLDRFPYPFADDAFDEVVSRHVVEHVADVMGFVNELYRITRPGGTIKILCPHYTNPDFPTDPTHRNHLNSYSFTCFSPDKRLYDTTRATYDPKTMALFSDILFSSGFE